MMDKILQLYKDSFGGLSKEVWLLAAVMFINRAGTMVITFLMIYLTVNLDFSLAKAGLVMGCFGVGSALGSAIGGWLTDKLGYFWVMFFSLFFGGFAMLFLIPLESFWAWCLGVTLMSTIADSFRPANNAAIGAYSKPENRTRSLSLIRVSFNLGLTFGPAVGGWIAIKYGYNYLFILDGLTCMTAAVCFYFLLPKKEVLSVEEEKERSNIETRPAYKDTFFLKFIFCMFLNMLVFMHLFTVLLTYWKEVFILTEQQIGWLLGINGLIIAFFEMPMIYILEKKYKVFPLIAGGAFLIGMAYWIYPIFDLWTGTLMISILAITFGEIINFPFLNLVALNRAPVNRRGEYMGWYGASFSIALILAPPIGGWIADHYGYNFLWTILGGLSIISVLGFYSLQNEYEAEQAKIQEEKDEKLEFV